MKRRYLSVVLIFILVVTAVGCSKGNTPTPSPTVTAPPESPSAGPEVTTPDPIKPDDNKTSDIAGEKANASGTLYAIDKLIRIPNHVIEACAYYDNRTLVITYRAEDNNCTIALYDIYTGEITKEAPLDYDMYVDQLTVCDNGNIFISTTWGTYFMLLNKELEVILNSETVNQSFSSVISAHDGNTLYYLDKDGYTLNKYSIDTKVSTLVTTFSDQLLSLMLLQMTDDNQYLTVQYTNSSGGLSYLIFNVETKEIQDLGSYTNNMITSGQMYAFADYDYTSKGYIETFHANEPRVLSRKYFMDVDEGNYFRLNGNTNTIVSVSKLPGTDNAVEGGVIRLYDANSMRVNKETKIDYEVVLGLAGHTSLEDLSMIGYYIWGNSMYVSDDRKTAFIMYCVDTYTGVLVWNLDKESDTNVNGNQSIPFTNKDEITSEDNDEYAQKISSEYGVDIYIRDKVVRYFPDFAVNAMYDETTTNEALKIVEDLLSKYPKGFFNELKYGEINKFGIYLCGTLVQGSEYGISNPGGFALQYDKTQMVVMDITYTGSIKTSLAHEIMHAMENRIDYLVSKGKIKNKIYTNWDKLNPKDHDYRYGYVDENGVEYDAINNAAYTPNDEKSRDNVDNIYYIDYYANTFPNEDRARIFETLITSDTELGYEFTSKHIKEKAVYLCRMIRTAFKTIPENELMPWEKFLGDVVFKKLK